MGPDSPAMSPQRPEWTVRREKSSLPPSTVLTLALKVYTRRC